mmetsp:Transcript_17338/g.26835  ORF Transcript_17338/g.26835 Transcript_17338/m.26835 type:complete len:345 (-) Transcript_17338:853-1887(-)
MSREKGGGKGKDKKGKVDDEISGGQLLKKPKEYEVKFSFPDPPKLQPPFLTVEQVGFQYPNGPKVFDEISIGIWPDSRVAIVGANGCGKSTLLNLLTGDLDATTGEVRRNPRLRVGRYNQHFVDVLPSDKSPVEYLQQLGQEYDNEAFQQIHHCRQQLGRYGLEGHAHMIPSNKLSGGQKARVVFAGISISTPHMLLFDEPTNHLDIQSIEALSEAIREFKGGVVLVSHDARLIKEAVESHERGEIWVVEQGSVKIFDGDMDDYQEKVLVEMNEIAEAADGKLKLHATEGATTLKIGGKKATMKQTVEVGNEQEAEASISIEVEVDKGEDESESEVDDEDCVDQ